MLVRDQEVGGSNPLAPTISQSVTDHPVAVFDTARLTEARHPPASLVAAVIPFCSYDGSHIDHITIRRALAPASVRPALIRVLLDCLRPAPKGDRGD
jgi:hypothetical protein